MDRLCPHCGAPLGHEKRANATYCSSRCAHNAAWRRRFRLEPMRESADRRAAAREKCLSLLQEALAQAKGRNAEIITSLVRGASMAEVARHHRVARQRIVQIVGAAVCRSLVPPCEQPGLIRSPRGAA